MNKMELKYHFQGSDYILGLEIKNKLKIFIEKDDSTAIITDSEGNVLAFINADCSQNSGYLSISRIDD